MVDYWATDFEIGSTKCPETVEMSQIHIATKARRQILFMLRFEASTSQVRATDISTSAPIGLKSMNVFIASRKNFIVCAASLILLRS